MEALAEELASASNRPRRVLSAHLLLMEVKRNCAMNKNALIVRLFDTFERWFVQ